ncbi:hypothetical protein ACEPAH_9458 [Sanghuangporus vaninii]
MTRNGDIELLDCGEILVSLRLLSLRRQVRTANAVGEAPEKALPSPSNPLDEGDDDFADFQAASGSAPVSPGPTTWRKCDQRFLAPVDHALIVQASSQKFARGYKRILRAFILAYNQI